MKNIGKAAFYTIAGIALCIPIFIVIGYGISKGFDLFEYMKVHGPIINAFVEEKGNYFVEDVMMAKFGEQFFTITLGIIIVVLYWIFSAAVYLVPFAGLIGLIYIAMCIVGTIPLWCFDRAKECMNMEPSSRRYNFVDKFMDMLFPQKVIYESVDWDDMKKNFYDSQNQNSAALSQFDKAKAMFMIDDMKDITEKDLKKTRNRLMKAIHPDGQAQTEHDQEFSTKQAQKINDAYELLLSKLQN